MSDVSKSVKTKLETGRQYRATGAMEAKKSEKRIESEYYVEGYATVFDSTYDIPGVMSEIVERSSLDDADMSDVIMQYDHEGKVVARMSNSTLIVEPDEHGLFVAADLSKSEAARALYTEIQEGLICQMSWGFLPSEMVYDSATDTNTIQGVSKVFDVSAVSVPACDATEISARTLLDGEIKKGEAERLRLRTKLQLKTRLLILESE